MTLLLPKVPESTFSESPPETSADEFVEDVPVPELTQQLTRAQISNPAIDKLLKTYEMDTEDVGGSGGSLVTARCPGESFIDWWRIHAGAMVDKIQGRCNDQGKTWLASCGKTGGHESQGPGDMQKIDIQAGSLVDRFNHKGGHGGHLHTLKCKPGYRIAGYRMKCGSLVDRVGFICRPTKQTKKSWRERMVKKYRANKADKAQAYDTKIKNTKMQLEKKNISKQVADKTIAKYNKEKCQSTCQFDYEIEENQLHGAHSQTQSQTQSKLRQLKVARYNCDSSCIKKFKSVMPVK